MFENLVEPALTKQAAEAFLAEDPMPDRVDHWEFGQGKTLALRMIQRELANPLVPEKRLRLMELRSRIRQRKL